MTRLQFLGKNIKKYRLQSNYSQEFLAEKCDLSREYISRIESGQKYVSLKKIFFPCGCKPMRMTAGSITFCIIEGSSAAALHWSQPLMLGAGRRGKRPQAQEGLLKSWRL